MFSPAWIDTPAGLGLRRRVRCPRPDDVAASGARGGRHPRAHRQVRFCSCGGTPPRPGAALPQGWRLPDNRQPCDVVTTGSMRPTRSSLFLGAGIVCVTLAVSGVRGWARTTRSRRCVALLRLLSCNTTSFLYTTRRGKFLEWDRILDRLSLRGDEGVLDMGCGRGAVLTAVARRLTTGRVTGVDIWSTKGPVGQRQGRHPAQRVSRRRGRSRADRHRGHARASLSRCGLRSRGLEPRYPQHPIERRSQAGHRRGLSRPQTRRPDGHRGHPRHGGLRREPCGRSERRMWNAAGWGGDSGGETRSPPRPC